MTNSNLPQRPAPRRKGSGEAARLSLLVIVSLAAAVLSGYFAIRVDGDDKARLILSLLTGGWVIMMMFAFSRMPRQSHS